MNFKYFLILALFSILAIDSIGCEKLVWSDEFDYEGRPDLQKWGYDIGGNGWGNNELQYYTNSTNNAFVEDGYLTIKAIKESFQGSSYTSARLVTKNKGDWKYGKFEIRAKLPKGRGTWPAIWMLPTDWKYGGWPESGEIDIMEHVGYDENVVHGTVHTEAYNHSKGTQKGGSKVVSNATSDFHIYGIEWREDRIDFFIDRVKYFTFYKESDNYQQWPFNESFHLILNIAIGGNWGGANGVDNSIFPTEMVVDYVRVYELVDELIIQGKKGVNKSEQNVEFYCTEIDGAEYTWTVPDNVDLIEGQGTSRIKVNWGDTDEKIKVQIKSNGDCNGKAAEAEIKISYSTNKFELLIDDFDNSSLGAFADNELLNTEKDNGRLSITKNEEKTTLSYLLNSPVDISNHTLLNVPLNSYGTIKNQVVISLFDTENNRLKYGPVDLTNNTWNIFKHLAYDFSGATNDDFQFELLRQIDFQFAKEPIKLTLEQLAFYRTDTLPDVPKNLQIVSSDQNGQNAWLWWENSANANNYEVKFAAEENGKLYSLNSNVSGLEVPFQVSFSGSKKYFAVIAKNKEGLSEQSNAVSLQTLSLEEYVEPYEITYEKGALFYKTDFIATDVYIYDLNGALVFNDEILSDSNGSILLNGRIVVGVYIVCIRGPKGRIVSKKLLVN